MQDLSIDRITALLGEEPFTCRVAMPCKTGFFPVDRWNGYRVTQKEERVVIAPVRPMATLWGWSPVFYFTGQLRNDAPGEAALHGRIKMKLLPKMFVLVWTGFVLLGLTFGSVFALYNAFHWLLNPSEQALGALAGAGLMVGTAVCLLFFAALLFFVMGFFSRGERQRLKDFCKSYGCADSPPHLSSN